MDVSLDAADRKKIGWKHVSSQTVVLGGEEVKAFAAKHWGLPKSPSERDLNVPRKKELQTRIANELATTFNWATVEYEGVRYRMNGQHSSAAILESNGTLPDRLVFHVDEYVAYSKEGMAKLFQQFDARWSSRSKTDVSGAYQGLEKDIADCNRVYLRTAIDGVAFYRKSIQGLPLISRSGNPISGDTLYNLFFEEDLHPFLKWYDSLISRKTPEMKSPAIAGAMYATFCKSETGAREFWHKVALGNLDVENGHASANLLAEDLQNNQGLSDKSKKLKPAFLYAKSILAWNAFRTGTKVKALTYQPKKGLPEIED